MKTILVTGKIGGGKSEVCSWFRGRGVPVYDCDSRCKALYGSVPGLKEKISAALGVPFSQIGVIFSDDRRREILESIVYPLLADDLKSWRDGLDSPLAVIESAVALYKRQFDGLYDAVLYVDAPYATRVSRNPIAAQRDRLQGSAVPHTDYYVLNDGTLDELYKKLENLKI